ncbi:hypothetical protein [Pseudoxanthomonas mexicana]|uniref:hypothetical protein n=1 Tax=Pseudoxanthomonas mexicana TaxID=128785 RepID=UPI00398B58B1
MLRTILAVLAGLITAIAVIAGLELIGMTLFPLPPGTPLATEADLAALVAAASTGKKIWVVAGWALGSFAGAWVAAKLARQRALPAALAVALFIVAGTVMNAVSLPHPVWMNALGIALPLPLAWLAARLARPRRQ